MPHCGSYGHQQGSGKPDRFIMFDDAERSRGWCRRCGHFEFASDSRETKVDAARLEWLKEERRRLAIREYHRMQVLIKRLQEKAVWEAFHQSLTDDQRLAWTREGIPPPAQDLFMLGWTRKEFFIDEQMQPFDSMTIPYFRYGQVVNIQYRLMGKKRDKYRFTKGCTPYLFRANDQSEPLGGRVLLVEGAKKAIVNWLNVGDSFDYVAASPSKTTSLVQCTELADASEIFLAFDPDANWLGQTMRTANKLGKDRCSIVELPAKPDDLFSRHGMKPKQFMAYVSQAVPCSLVL